MASVTVSRRVRPAPMHLAVLDRAGSELDQVLLERLGLRLWADDDGRWWWECGDLYARFGSPTLSAAILHCLAVLVLPALEAVR